MYFDNTGGPVTNIVYRHLAPGARIVLCGLVAEYGLANAGGHDLRPLLAKQATLTAFSVRSHLQRMREWCEQGAAWIRDGKLVYREDVLTGIERAPEAFMRMLAGRTLGKALVRVAEERSYGASAPPRDGGDESLERALEAGIASASTRTISLCVNTYPLDDE